MLLLLFLISTIGTSSNIVSAVTRRTDELIHGFPGSPSVRAELEVRIYTNQRTNMDILWSCLATIFACTWVAVHPNVPGPRESEWTRFRRRCSTMFYAIIAPEMMMLWAMRQRYAAARIKMEYNLKYNENCKSYMKVCLVDAKPRPDLFSKPDPLGHHGNR
jgi:hypothetical protein